MTTHSSHITKSSFNNGNTSLTVHWIPFSLSIGPEHRQGKKGMKLCIYTNNLNNYSYFHFLTREQTLAKGREKTWAVMMERKDPS